MLSCLVKENTDVMISWTSHVDKYYLDHVETLLSFLGNCVSYQNGLARWADGAVADSVRKG